ncbi:MAG: thermonuclease family protein [Thermoleophilaceae bacterium]|nr:thermonuclease family protein [Thermoleophilaceae bacterium]
MLSGGARLAIAGLAGLVLAFGAGGVAHAQTSYPATVTSVVDGDTLHASVAGQDVTVRVIGIDTPETRKPGTPVECGGPEASETMESLVLGQSVNLVSDPTQDAVDRYGRSLFYVDRADGLDVGLAMIRAGWAAAYVYDEEPQRIDSYDLAAEDAAEARRGAWGLCRGDFHRTARDERIERADTAKKFVRFYYFRLSRDRYRQAWSMLSPQRKAQVRPFRRWKAGYRGSLSVAVTAAAARLSGNRAVVRVRLRARDRDACVRRGVVQRFRGTVTLVPRGDLWAIHKSSIRKTGGKKPRTSKSQCPGPRRPPPPPPDDGPDCHPSYPDFCIPPAPPDLDCDDVNGSDFTVRGDDPHGFDAEGDGRGCES